MDSQQVNRAFSAAQHGDVEILRTFLDTYPGAANIENGDGLTLLGYAAHFGQTGAVRLLLDGGADVNAMSHSKISFIPSNTALHAAIAGNHGVEVVEFLVQHGSDVNATDSLGHTPLQAAAFEGRTEIASLLIAHGADPRRQQAGTKSAAQLADDHEHPEFAAYLRQHGA